MASTGPNDKIPKHGATSVNRGMSDLQTAFRFTDEDLAANRQGLATKQQTSRLNQLQGCTLLLAGFLTSGLIIFIAGAGILTGLFALVGSPISPLKPATGLLLPLGFMLVSLFIFALFLVGLRRDRREKRVARCMGTIALESRAVTTDSFYDYLHVNGHRFKITRFQTRSLRRYEGQQMTIYYFPRSRQIASLELAV